MSARLVACPVTRDEVNTFVREHHRHHGPVVGYRFGAGVELDGKLVGVAAIGRPVARQVEQYRAAEVVRVATDGTRNACSFLYGVCSRLTKLLGFTSCFTAILESETGTSLRAAGWLLSHTTRGGKWDRPSRSRKRSAVEGPKQIWVAPWCQGGAT
jgi:hypothetical protein